MVRTAVSIAILCIAVLVFPLWLQVVLFGVALFVVSPRLLLVIPALLSDAWYAPSWDISLKNHRMTIIVMAMIVLYEVVIRTTRLSERYGTPKK